MSQFANPATAPTPTPESVLLKKEVQQPEQKKKKHHKSSKKEKVEDEEGWASTGSNMPGRVSGESSGRLTVKELQKSKTAKTQSVIHMINQLGDDEDDELDAEAIVEALVSHAKANRHVKGLKRTVAALILLYIITVGAMLGTSIMGSEMAKDTWPDANGAMITRAGAYSKTEIVANYATLLDLPKLGRAQLAKINNIDLTSSDGLLSFKVAGYMTRSASKLTLFTTANADINIDSAAKTAEVDLKNGIKIPVKLGEQQTATRRRILSDRVSQNQAGTCNAAGACLFTQAEIEQLQVHHDEQGRKMLSTGGEGISYVSLDTSEINSLQTLDQLLSQQTSDLTSFVGTGTINGLTIRFAKNSTAGVRVALVFPNSDMHIYEGDMSYKFSNGLLTECLEGRTFPDLSNLESGADAVTFTITSKLDGVADPSFIPSSPALADCRTLLFANMAAASASSGASSGRRLLSEDGTKEYVHARHRDMGLMREALHQVHANPETRHLASLTHDGHGRKLLAVDNSIVLEMAAMADDVYYGSCAGKSYGQWACAGNKQDDNAYANYFQSTTSGSRCAIVFRGSDDIGDWLSNGLGVFSSKTTCGVNTHSGFSNEYSKFASWINTKKTAGCTDMYFSGHSLGGAIASVADKCHGGTSVLFSSPKPFGTSGLSHSEYRAFHDEDPVSGTMLGAMTGYYHAGGSVFFGCPNWDWVCTGSWYTAYLPCGWQCPGGYKVQNGNAWKGAGATSSSIAAHNMESYVPHLG